MYSIKKSDIFENIKGMPTYTDYINLLDYAKHLEEDKIAEIESVKGHYEKCKRRIEALEKENKAFLNINEELEKEKDMLNMIIYDKNQKIKQYENAINDKNRRLKKKENIIKILVNKLNNNGYIPTDNDDIEALTDSLVQANKSNEELYKENEELKQKINSIYGLINEE